MAATLAIVLLLAAVSRQSYAGDYWTFSAGNRSQFQEWERNICAAYFKVSGLDRSMFPAGQLWEDNVCVNDPSFYLACKYFNGLFSGEKRQCPPGKLFYHGKNQLWEKTCVPANKCDRTKQCPNWLQIAPPTPVLKECLRRWYEAQRAFDAGAVDYYQPQCDVNGDYMPLQCSSAGCWCVSPDGAMVSEVQRVGLSKAKCLLYRKDPFYGKDESPISKDLAPVSSGTHGCIDCVIGECHKCLCNAALKWGNKGVAYVVDPNNKARNQYLVCEGTRITCHPCPKGLVFDCRRGVCATTGECPSIPAKCYSSCPVSTKGQRLGFKLGLKRDQTPAIFPTVVTPKVIVTSVSTAGLTKRQCACKMALKASGLSSAYACDPYLQQNYLVCQDDGTFESKTCPVGKAWSYVEKTCSEKMRQCRPLTACSDM